MNVYISVEYMIIIGSGVLLCFLFVPCFIRYYLSNYRIDKKESDKYAKQIKPLLDEIYVKNPSDGKNKITKLITKLWRYFSMKS